jgi:hypothetical protein
MHRYNNQDDSMLAAKAAVDCIVSGSTDKTSLWSVNIVDEYHEERTSRSDVEKLSHAHDTPRQLLSPVVVLAA